MCPRKLSSGIRQTVDEMTTPCGHVYATGLETMLFFSNGIQQPQEIDTHNKSL